MKSGKEILSAKQVGRPYKLNTVCRTFITNTGNNFRLWHNRLGHVNTQSLNLLKDHLNIKINSDTDICKKFEVY